VTGEDLVVTPGLVLPARELVWRFGPSSGPGGQHANRSHTRAELRWDVLSSSVLDQDQRHRLLDVFGPVVVTVADRSRSQNQNREQARRRLAERVEAALHVDKPRQATRPGAGAERRRLAGKRRRAELKVSRRRPSPDD
jgi:ribosome-associated protein